MPTFAIPNREMAERSNAAVLKTVDPQGPGVRIPLSLQKPPRISLVAFLIPEW